ncbi:MAG: Na/Pi cotransporter family protein [Opitutaceae bacterium]|nr:Na/Pi cotransporter family protein [Opitutaceae bacterium]
MGLVNIAAGIALTLFGIRFLRKGLDRLFGKTLFYWLSKLSKSRLRAFAGGIVVGTAAPSSTGLAVLGAQMLGRDTEGLSAANVLAILLGASVGLTVTVQLLSFHIGSLAGVLVVAGVWGYQFCRRDVLRGTGQCLLALGFIFLAMSMVGEGATEVTANPEVRGLLLQAQGNAVVVFLVVCVLAVALQSSTATIAFGLALAASGLLTPAALIPWVLGTNVGLGVTSLLMGWSRLESRRLGLSSVIAKLLVAVPLLLLPTLTHQWFEAMPGSVMRQTAMSHTLFNLVVAMIVLPLIGPLSRVVGFIVPKPVDDTLAVSDHFLDPRALETASLALARATRETLRMADHVRVMLENFWSAFGHHDAALARKVQKGDDVVDRMNVEIKEYLSRIAENRDAEDTNWQFTLLAYSAELEAVGDLVDKHLCDALLKQRSERVEMVEADRRHLEEAYRRALHSLDVAIGLLTTRGIEDAKALVREKHEFNEWAREMQRQHYETLAFASPERLASSRYFVDAFNALRRINSHLSAIGYSFLPPDVKSRNEEAANGTPGAV